MPFIKYKPFALSQALCYKCGKEIKQGDLNWSYNTHQAGMFSHRDCLKSEEIFKQELESHPAQVSATPVLAESEPKAKTEPLKTSLDDITSLITLEGKHEQIVKIKLLLKKRKYPFLYGAPGAGKSHLAIQIADDMKLDCILCSCSNDMFKSELLGSVSPISGNYYATAFRKAWEHGGVILLDEVALAAGAFVNLLNSALAQKELRFPDGRRVKMHENTFILFADNSAGYGNDPLFPERQDLGTAFRDRPAFIEFRYDERLELSILTSRFKSQERAARFHLAIKGMRLELAKLAVPVFASPRFAYESAELMQDDSFSFLECCEMLLLRGINGDIKSLVVPIINKFNQRY